MRAAAWANKVALQGNMDPSMLYAPPARIEEEVATILAGFGHGEGHVFNLGHGIHQDVPARTCWRICGGSAIACLNKYHPLRSDYGSSRHYALNKLNWLLL